MYARELGQHSESPDGSLRDALDEVNHYVVARQAELVVGFISITPPSAGRYSIEKYFQQSDLPFDFHQNLYEIRLLTVLGHHRRRSLFLLLSYAAFRWVEAHGGMHVCGMGRLELMAMYHRFGMLALPHTTESGAVSYQLMHASVRHVSARAARYAQRLMGDGVDFNWQLDFPFEKPAECFHGGAFFALIGEDFQNLELRKKVINADVLDAWFPPAPGVIEAMTSHLPWLLRTSPPTGCDGLIARIANVRGVGINNILPGAGSSDLIFRAFCHWLSMESKVLILDPTYGEYGHVLEKVIGCQVTRFQLDLRNGYKIDLDRLKEELVKNYDLVVLVNPNSPTGCHVSAYQLENMIRAAPIHTRIWVDETYIDYVGISESLETYAADSENVIVCKSMSKVYALSGARVAYLCAGRHQLESLRALTPPWVVGLPSQVAAVKALEDEIYYSRRYAETHLLREQLTIGLTELGWNVLPGVANFLLCELPPNGTTPEVLITACREKHLFLRNPKNMGGRQNQRLIRIAVKDAQTNARILLILSSIAKEQSMLEPVL